MKKIPLSLTLKLTLTFVAVSLSGIALVAVMVWAFNANEFNRLIIARGQKEYIAAVTDYYQEHNSWDGVSEALRAQGFMPSREQIANGAPPAIPFLLLDVNGNVIVQTFDNHPSDQPLNIQSQDKVAIEVGNQTVGYVVTTGRPPQANPFEQRYFARTNIALLVAALLAIILAAVLGALLTRTIVRPVRDLTEATSIMARGQAVEPLPVRSSDELGTLTRSFNQMSSDLAQANQLRRQMTADIAHDLRTPLAVITGYLEGLKDGVIKPTHGRMAAMYDEAIYLQRLVEDLRTLSLADAGELSMNLRGTQPGEVIERAASSFQQLAEEKGIHLQTVVGDDLPALKIDPERILQAINNLVSNAIRYTPAGGEIRLEANLCHDGDCAKAVENEGDWVCLRVCDSGVGISAEALPHVFDRFYRGDDSRQEGGSGLGLAIARSIVELHKGEITVSSQGENQGSQFCIRLPVPTAGS